jgi:hypothetical protein
MVFGASRCQEFLDEWRLVGGENPFQFELHALWHLQPDLRLAILNQFASPQKPVPQKCQPFKLVLSRRKWKSELRISATRSSLARTSARVEPYP